MREFYCFIAFHPPNDSYESFATFAPFRFLHLKILEPWGVKIFSKFRALSDFYTLPFFYAKSIVCLVFNPKCILADDESKHNASRFWLWIHTDFNDYIQVAIYKTQNFAIKTLPSKKTIPSGCNIYKTQNFATKTLP